MVDGLAVFEVCVDGRLVVAGLLYVIGETLVCPTTPLLLFGLFAPI